MSYLDWCGTIVTYILSTAAVLMVVGGALFAAALAFTFIIELIEDLR